MADESDAPTPPAGPPAAAVVRWKGKEYVLPPVDQDAMKLAHALFNAYALDQVRATEPYTDPAAFARDYREAMSLVTSGHYWYDAKGGWELRGTVDGALRVVYACLAPKYPHLKLATVLNMAADLGWKALLDALALANADPTRPPGDGRPDGDSGPG